MQREKKRIRIVLVLLILLMMIPVFLRVTQVQVEGNQYYTEQEIEDLVFPDSFSRSPLLIFLNGRLGNYREIPFVQKYRVTLTGLTFGEDYRIREEHGRLCGIYGQLPVLR